jgi:hypothetical protein
VRIGVLHMTSFLDHPKKYSVDFETFSKFIPRLI